MFTELELLLTVAPLTVRQPDVMVCARQGQSDKRALAEETHLVVEIISPSSGRTDRVMKLAEYAEAGIPCYWIVDLHAGEVICFALSGSSYDVVGRGPRVTDVEVCGVGITLDVADLTA